MKKNDIVNLLITLYAVCAFGYITFEFGNINMSNFGNFFLYTLCGIFCLMKYGVQAKTEIANDWLLWCVSFAFSASVVLGYHFTCETVITLKVLILFVFSIGGLTFAYKALFTKLYNLLEKWACKEKGVEKIDKTQRKKQWLKAFVFIMLCWIVVWLAYYPGFINYDHEQIMQVMNSEYTTHHPLLHTFMFGGLYKLGLKTGNPVTGIILYSFIQMSIMAAIFAYSYVYIKERISSNVFCGAVLVFYAVFPVNSILALSTTKDVIFSGLVLLCLVHMLRFMDGENQRKSFPFVINALIILMLLLRNNAFYAFVLMLIVAVCLVKLQKNSKKIIICMLVCIVAYKGGDGALKNAVSAQDGSIGEMLSLPSQQFGRIYLVAEENGDYDTMRQIEKFYQMEKAVYKPALSDLMKYYFIDIDNSNVLKDYLKTSVELFKKYPMPTVQAVIYITQGYWDVNDISHAQIYGTKTEDRFGYLPTKVYGGYGVKTESKIPALEILFEEAFTNNKYQYVPIISMLCAPAVYFWFLALYTLQMLKAKKRDKMFLCSFFWFYILTLLAGPCVLIRYIYPLVISTPVLITTMATTISDKKTEKNYGQNSNSNPLL